MFRFLTPVLPLLAALALYPIVLGAERWIPSRRRSRGIVTAGLMLLVASAWLIGRPARQLDRLVREAHMAEEWSTIGRWLARTASPEHSLATIVVGAVGFHSGLRIIDPHGIVETGVAHLDIELGRGYAGHEKFDVAGLLARKPDYVILQNRLTLRPVRLPEFAQIAWGNFNKQMVREREFADAYDYRPAEILPGRFLNLYVRKDL